MTHKATLVLALAMLAIPVAAYADIQMTFRPNPADMNGLDHSYAYLWGIQAPLGPGESVTQAQLTFHSIRNWDDQANVLYAQLLDTAELGLHQVYDNQGDGDYFETRFAGPHAHLVTYENLPSTPQTLVYTFTPAQVLELNNYLADGQIGIGLDPDCHYYNDGIELGMTIVPEPAALGLVAAGLFLCRRR